MVGSGSGFSFMAAITCCKPATALLVLFVVAGCASKPPPPPQNRLLPVMARADQAYEQGRWLEAQQGYQAIVDAVPEDHYAWFRLGNTMLRQGRVENAVHNYHKAIEQNPDEPKAHYNLAIANLLSALDSMQRSYDAMRESDPGRRLVRKRMDQLRQLIDQPLDIDAPSIGGAARIYVPQ